MSTSSTVQKNGNGAVQTTTNRMPAVTQQSTALAQIEQMQAIANSALPSAIEKMSDFEKAIRIGTAVDQLRKSVFPEWQKILMSLQGTHLGFRTDKDAGGGYEPKVLIDCWIEATLKGARTTGNEFNIISGRAYLTKEFYQRAVRELVTIINDVAGVPMVKDGKTLVRYLLHWKDGAHEQMLLDAEGKPGRIFVVKVNSGMGDDAVIGKATRKAFKAAFELITGRTFEYDEPPDSAPSPSTRRMTSFADSAESTVIEQAPDDVRPVKPETINEARAVNLRDLAESVGYDAKRLAFELLDKYRVEELEKLTSAQADDFAGLLRAKQGGK